MTEQEKERQEASSTQDDGADSAQRAAEEAATETAADALEALRQELDEANRKGQEYLSLLQRVQADFVNYRRRVEQERGESLQAGKAQLALRILPILDDFDRGIKARPAELSRNEWAQGVDLIARKLRTAMEAEGITRIETLGKEFDPWEHEALVQAPSSAEDAGKVIEVFQEGYKLGNKVLRPAQVKVGRGP